MNQAVLCSFKSYRWPISAFMLTMCTITVLSFAMSGRFGSGVPHSMSQLRDLNFGVDSLACLLLCVVGILGTVVFAYAARYLQSDVTRTRFLVQLCLTIGSVLFFIFSNNLFTAFIGWQWIGLNLYLLLNHYHYQSAANRAAKKKFIINRLGDMCFLLAIVLCYQFYGTTDYEQLAQLSQEVLPFFGGLFNSHTLILGLIMVAIMTKSAQFPFHIWLPDTMQTPTPVSALMHAGVINAGGILLARLAPMFTQTTWLPYVMLMVGINSLIVGSLLKSTQADVKKRLAYSTMSQMGYMLMQSATGCFAAAVFHLIGHGFYKAALFLNAGNSLFEQEILTYKKQGHGLAIVLLSFLLVSLGIAITRTLLPHASISILIWAFIAISLEQLVRSALLQNVSFKVKGIMIGIFGSILVSYMWMLTIFESQMGLPNLVQIDEGLQYILALTVITIHTLIIFIPQQSLQKSPVVRKFYGVLLNKLHIEEIFRSCLLYPIRDLGDWLNKKLLEKPIYSLLIFIISLLMPLMMLIVKTMAVESMKSLMSVLIGLGILAMLVMANRARSLTQILQGLFASHFLILALTMLNDSSQLVSHQPMIIIAYVGLFGSLQWLIAHASKLSLHSQRLVVENRLTVWGTYLAIFLFLVIGIPGTASFVVWFQLVSSLTANPIMLVILLLANIMLAIVVLHTLQDYVFNLQNSYELTKNKKWLIHSVFTCIIIINLCCGWFPQIIKVSL